MEKKNEINKKKQRKKKVLKIQLPKQTYQCDSGIRRRLLADVVGATTKKEFQKRWEITEGEGKIDENGLFCPPILLDGEEGQTTEIRVISEADPSVYERITVTTRRAPFIDPATTHTKILSIIIAAIAVIGIGLSFLSLRDGLAILGLSLILVGISFHEIQTPYLGFLFMRGILIGKLSPGWYLLIPVVWSVMKKTTELISADMDEEMYVKSKTPINIKAICYYQLVDPRKAVQITDTEIQKKVEALMSSQTKTAIGQKSFQELISHQATLENTIQMEIDDEIKRNGYITTTFELVDLLEKVESEAEKIKRLGDAQAKVMGKQTKAVADAVGDQWQGVIAVAAKNLSEALAKRIVKSGDTAKSGD